MDFRGFSDVFQGVFWVFPGGFPMKFQMDFGGVSGVYQIVFGRFSVPLNQILFGRYSEHKSPIVYQTFRRQTQRSTNETRKEGWNYQPS